MDKAAVVAHGWYAVEHLLRLHSTARPYARPASFVDTGRAPHRTQKAPVPEALEHACTARSPPSREVGNEPSTDRSVSWLPLHPRLAPSHPAGAEQWHVCEPRQRLQLRGSDGFTPSSLASVRASIQLSRRNQRQQEPTTSRMRCQAMSRQRCGREKLVYAEHVGAAPCGRPFPPRRHLGQLRSTTLRSTSLSPRSG